MTRRWTDSRHLVQMIKLFMVTTERRKKIGIMSMTSLALYISFQIDEVHILNEQRGAVLEACVSRMKVSFELSFR